MIANSAGESVESIDDIVGVFKGLEYKCEDYPEFSELGAEGIAKQHCFVDSALPNAEIYHFADDSAGKVGGVEAFADTLVGNLVEGGQVLHGPNWVVSCEHDADCGAVQEEFGGTVVSA